VPRVGCVRGSGLRSPPQCRGCVHPLSPQLTHTRVSALIGTRSPGGLSSFTTESPTLSVASAVLNGGIGEAVLGALLLVIGGAVACAVIVAGSGGPPQGYLAYGGAVLWALTWVVVNQYQNSLITSLTAIVCAVSVAAVLFAAPRRSGVRRIIGQPSKTRVV
jgi:hypothetical protein